MPYLLSWMEGNIPYLFVKMSKFRETLAGGKGKSLVSQAQMVSALCFGSDMHSVEILLQILNVDLFLR